MNPRKTSWLEWSALTIFGACALAVACDVSNMTMGTDALRGAPPHWDGGSSIRAVDGQPMVAGAAGLSTSPVSGARPHADGASTFAGSNAIGLGQLCARPSDPPCPTGSDCLVNPSAPAPGVGFCSPLCSASSPMPQCPYVSAPPGIRTQCASSMQGYLSDHCFLLNEDCSRFSCPPGFKCNTGGCFPE